jgi:hypothetical protein
MTLHLLVVMILDYFSSNLGIIHKSALLFAMTVRLLAVRILYCTFHARRILGTMHKSAP